MAIFEAPSYERIFAIFQDEEYQRVVVPDEEVRNANIQVSGSFNHWESGCLRQLSICRLLTSSEPMKKSC
ncbi:hypothetical protein BDR22DRAFT_103903 [Usnea florida]